MKEKIWLEGRINKKGGGKASPKNECNYITKTLNEA